jgi:predicted Zn-dependent peptidase
MAGVSHYIEHLMFKGTKKRKTTQILTREIDRLGAAYNAFTGKEYTGYYIKTDGAYTHIALDILSDMLFHSTFDPREMEREKGPIIEELRMYRDNPLMNIGNVFEDLLFAGSTLGRDIGGSYDTVRSFRRDDVLAFRDRYYGPNNMTIVIAGAVTDHTRKLVEEYIGGEQSVRLPKQTLTPAGFGSRKKADRLMVEERKTDQAQLMLGFPGFSHTDKQNPAAQVMNTILGGSMSSRLFIQVRERRGLAYMIKSGLDNYRDTGYAYVRAGLEAKNINKALQVICGEMEKLATKEVTAQELVDAKTHIRGGLTLSLEDSSEQADWYAREALFEAEIHTPEDRLQAIEAVTAADVKRVAKKLFVSGEMRVAIIGDVKKDTIEF